MKNDDPSAGILEVFEKSSFNITETLQPLHTDLLFLNNATNLVIGESKAGKTYTIIESLVDCGFKDQVIHLDFDRNSDQRLKELDVRTYHIKNAKNLYLELIESNKEEDKFKNSLCNKILVIDSLQDLAFEYGLDTNQGAYATVRYANIFRATGATLIIIHHVTMDNGKPKVKGNSSVITSQCDTTILLKKIAPDKRIMEVLNTRAEDKIASESEKEYPLRNKNQIQDQQTPLKPKRKNSRVPPK